VVSGKNLDVPGSFADIEAGKRIIAKFSRRDWKRGGKEKVPYSREKENKLCMQLAT